MIERNGGLMEDTISRKAAIDEIKALYEWHDTVTEDRTIDHLKRLPSAQPETHDKRTKTHSCDCISRQAAMEEISKQQTYKMFEGEDTLYLDANDVGSVLASLPSAHPEQTNSWCINSWCIDCKEYDKEKHSCPRFNRVIKQTLDEVYAHAETEAEARFHAEIVRCKDCRFYKSDGCFFSTAETIEDGFCSWAERKTDE